jgi:hypothetical protein
VLGAICNQSAEGERHRLVGRDNNRFQARDAEGAASSFFTEMICRR